jgi:glycosyltransferase involved in cell wall biosynthesis
VRILLLSDWMSQAGGSEVYITRLKRWLADSGDEVRLLTCGVRRPGAADTHALSSDSRMVQGALQLVNPFAVSALKRELRDFKPGAVVVSQFAFHASPAVFGALRDTPTVVSMMDYKAICPLGSKLLPDLTLCRERAGVVCLRTGCLSLPHWLRDQVRYALISGALEGQQVVCASRWIQEEMSRNGIASHRIPLPVDPAPATFLRNVAPHPLFAYVGRLSREKGVEVLLRSFAEVSRKQPASRLRIIGNGPLLGQLVALAASLGISANVDFIGRLEPEAVDSAIQDAWAVVAPSVWAEPYGLTVIEAIARAIPVVATETGGFADNVEEGLSGMLVTNGDVASLADALDAIAAARSFPQHTVAPEVVLRLTERLSPRRHVEALRAVFNATIERTRSINANKLSAAS